MVEDPETRKYLRALAKTSFFVFIAVVLSKAFSYGYKITIARYFGAEIYGIYSLAFIIIGVLTAVFSLGLPDGLIRYISYYRGSKEYSKIKILIIFSKKFFFITGIVSLIISIIFADYISTLFFDNEILGHFIKIMAFSIPFLLLSNIFISIIRSFEKIKTYSFLINIYLNGSRFFLILAFIFIGMHTNSIVFSYVLSVVGLLALSYVMSKKEYMMIQKSPELKDKKESKEVRVSLIDYAWPLVLVGIIYSLFYWTDSVMIGYFGSVEQVGFYNAAITLVSLFGIAPDLFMQLFYPLIASKLSQNKLKLINDLTNQVIKWILLINIPLLIAIFIFPEAAINIFFGSEFIFASDALRILTLGGIFSGLIGLMTNLISTKGRTKIVLVDFIVFLIINIILNAILIPKYGINGAATATSITWTLFFIISFIQVKKNYGFFPIKKDFIKIIISCLLPLSLLAFVGLNHNPNIFEFVLIFIIFSLIYLISLIITGTFDEKDKDIFRVVKNRFISLR